MGIVESLISGAAGVVGGAIGKAVGKVIDYIPGKKEGRRDKIDRLEKEQDKLFQLPKTAANRFRLSVIAEQLSKLYTEAKNSD